MVGKGGKQALSGVELQEANLGVVGSNDKTQAEEGRCAGARRAGRTLLHDPRGKVS